MGLSAEILDSSLRLSVARDTTLSDIDRAVEILAMVRSRS
jgi:cysteine sulfinate desulfinase/cysteine desulfurase-like protein